MGIESGRMLAAMILNRLIATMLWFGYSLGACWPGIICCIIIWLVGSYELSFERFHPDSNRIFRVVEDGKPGELKTTSVLASMAHAISKNIAGLDGVPAYYRENNMNEARCP